MIDEENETFLHVSREGQIISRHYAPGFRGSNSPDAAAGAATRVRGAGFEGVAISPDGNTVYGGHQTALLTFPAGEADVTFIAALHVPTNTWRTYKVPLDPVAAYDYPAGITPAVRMGMHDLSFDGYDAQGREQLIYIERDNKRDAEARDKRIYRVTLPDYATYDNTPVREGADGRPRRAGLPAREARGPRQASATATTSSTTTCRPRPTRWSSPSSSASRRRTWRVSARPRRRRSWRPTRASAPSR